MNDEIVKVTPGLGDLIQLYQEKWNPKTVRNYVDGLGQFAEFIGVESINDVARSLTELDQASAYLLVTRYRISLEQAGSPPNTINNRLTAVRALVSLARKLGLIAWELKIEGVKSEPYRDTFGPGADGFKKIVGDITGTKPQDFRDRAIIRLAFDLALRRSEISTLDLEHLLPDGGILVLRKKKRERIRLELPEPTRAAIAEWVAVRGDWVGPLFTSLDNATRGTRINPGSVWRIVVARSQKVGLKVSPHKLRHAAITHALDLTNGNISMVADFSGHQDPKTVMIYNDRREKRQGEVAKLVAG